MLQRVLFVSWEIDTLCIYATLYRRSGWFFGRQASAFMAWFIYMQNLQ
jgi:hypothetical protein